MNCFKLSSKPLDSFSCLCWADLLRNFLDRAPQQLEQRRQLGVAGLPAPDGPPLRIELAPWRWDRTTGALFRETSHWVRPLRRLVKKMMKDSSFFAQGRRYGGE